MKVIKDASSFQQHASRCVATIGKFDGVHLGHQAIIAQLKDKAAQLHLPSLVILIEPHPEEFFAASPEQCPPRLSILAEKITLLDAAGIDYVLQLQFDAALSQMSAEDTIQTILVQGLRVAAFIVGSDFRFGHQRLGDFALLKDRASKAGFEVIETASCALDGQRVSSTYIREQLGLGNFPLVERLLGRPYAISGEVIKGRQLGKDLGFPTCNINLHRQRIPLHGVFACAVRIQDKLMQAAVNIGYRPTLNDGGEALLEAHILDFSGDLYGKELEVIFQKKIREEEKFADLTALKAQIANDVEQVRDYFRSSPLISV